MEKENRIPCSTFFVATLGKNKNCSVVLPLKLLLMQQIERMR